MAAIEFKGQIRLGVASQDWKPTQKGDMPRPFSRSNPLRVWKNHSSSRKPLLKIGQHRPVADLHYAQNIRPNALKHSKQSRNLRRGLRRILDPPAIDDTWHEQVILKVVIGHYNFLGREGLKAKNYNPAKNPAGRHVDSPSGLRPVCVAASLPAL